MLVGQRRLRQRQDDAPLDQGLLSGHAVHLLPQVGRWHRAAEGSGGTHVAGPDALQLVEPGDVFALSETGVAQRLGPGLALGQGAGQSPRAGTDQPLLQRSQQVAAQAPLTPVRVQRDAQDPAAVVVHPAHRGADEATACLGAG